MAEVERKFIHERTLIGLAHRSHQRQSRRPPARRWRRHARRRPAPPRREGIGHIDPRHLGVGRSTLYRTLAASDEAAATARSPSPSRSRQRRSPRLLVSPVAGRRRQRPFHWPAAFQAPSDRALADPCSVHPVRKHPGLAPPLDVPVGALVPLLFPRCCPPAVRGLVVSVVVNAIDAEAVLIGGAHVCVEGREPPPAIAYLDTPAAVPGVCVIVGVCRPGDHGHPCEVHSRPDPGDSGSLASDLPCEATAGHGRGSDERSRPDFLDDAAVTPAVPHGPPFPAGRRSQDNQQANPAACKVRPSATSTRSRMSGPQGARDYHPSSPTDTQAVPHRLSVRTAPARRIDDGEVAEPLPGQIKLARHEVTVSPTSCRVAADTPAVATTDTLVSSDVWATLSEAILLHARHQARACGACSPSPGPQPSSSRDRKSRDRRPDPCRCHHGHHQHSPPAAVVSGSGHLDSTTAWNPATTPASMSSSAPPPAPRSWASRIPGGRQEQIRVLLAAAGRHQALPS